MIATVLALALLQQAVGSPSTLTVRIGERSSGIPVVATRLGAMVRLDDVLAPLGAVLMRDSEERFRLFVGGTELSLATGRATVGSRGGFEPLTAAPTLAQGQLYLPLTLFTEVLPRVATGFVYDAASGELRRILPVMAARPAPPTRDSSARTGGAAPRSATSENAP
ncbi:MAG: hypothetical protein ABI910_23045, partial [Gemmatimonadota bacterium]